MVKQAQQPSLKAASHPALCLGSRQLQAPEKRGGESNSGSSLIICNLLEDFIGAQQHPPPLQRQRQEGGPGSGVARADVIAE